jgi:uncharacterized peroxidase-related enzyme
MLTKDNALVDQIKVDYTKAILDSKTLAMLNYAVKLTVKPTSITEEEVDILRDRGCTDREILDVCQITSYFNFVNRMAEGLGVELEEEYR